IDDLNARLEDRNVHVELTSDAVTALVDDGYDKEFGARPLSRSIQKNVEDTLSEAILRGEEITGKTVFVDFKDDKFKVDTKEKSPVAENEQYYRARTDIISFSPIFIDYQNFHNSL